jgi:hypothetical protein
VVPSQRLFLTVIAEYIRIRIDDRIDNCIDKALRIYAGLINLRTERWSQAERTVLSYLTGLSCWSSGSKGESGERENEEGSDEHRRSWDGEMTESGRDVQ